MQQLGAEAIDAAVEEIARQVREKITAEGLRQSDVRLRCGFTRKQSRRASEFVRGTGDVNWRLRTAAELGRKLGIRISILVEDQEFVI